MSGVDSIDKYSKMMSWLTRSKSKIQEPRNMYQDGQLVAPSVDGSRPGYGGLGGNIRLSPTGNAYDVAVKRGDKFFYQTFHKDDYKNKSEALKAAKKFRDQKKKIFYKTGAQEPKYGPTTDKKAYMKKRYKETKELTEKGKLAKDRETKLKNFIGKKKKIKASVLRDFILDDLGYEKYEASKIKTKFPNLIIERDLGQGDWKPLNKQEKTFIKENFDLPEGQKKWDFDKHRYGISSDKHSSLWTQIKRKLKEPGKYTLAANFSDPQGWMMSAMERVYNNETTLLEDGTRVLKKGVKKLTYEPKFNKKGTIVGFIDNTVAGDGNTYYGLKKNAKEYGDGTEWRAHGDFNRIKKFIEIADGVRQDPNKLLQKILDDKGISELTKGNSSLTLNDILSHERYYSKLSETSPNALIRRQIVLHHKKGVGGGNLARAAATKDIQLLTDAVNLKVIELENIVKGTKKNPARKLNAGEILKLKNYGAKIVDFDGRVVGGGYTDPEKQFAKIEKGALKYARGKDFNVKTVTSYLERLGCGKAAGGRILMSNGGATLTDCAKKGQKVLEDVRTGKITGEAAEQIAKNTAKVVAKAGGKSALASLLGPYGIGLDVVYEVGSVGTDIYGGKPWKEAVQDNWIAGAFMPGTSQEEFHKSFFKKHPEAKTYGSGLDLEQAYIKQQQKIERLKADTTARGKADAARQLPQLERDLEGIVAQYHALDNAMQPGSPEYENYMAAKTEYLDARKTKAPSTKAKLEMELNRPTSDRAVSYPKGEPLKIDFSLPGNYTTFKPDLPPQLGGTLPTKREIDKVYTEEGYDLSPQDIDYVQKMEKWDQLFYNPENKGMGIRGTQDWRGAGGGIASLKKKW